MLLSLLEEYLKVRSRKKKAISPTTVMRYKHALKPFFDYIWQPGQRSSILQADENTFDQFMAHISMPDPAKKNRNIKPNQDRQYYSRNSIDLIVVAVKTFFKALVWVNALSKNLTEDLHSPNIPREERQPVLQAEQLQSLKQLESHPDPVLAARDAAILELGLSTMLRANEIVALDIEDLDLQNRIITVLGKGGKTRVLPLTKTPLNGLNKWLEFRSSLMTEHSNSALFLSASRRNRGSRIAYRGVYEVIRTLFQQLEDGQPGLRLGGLHTLRRSGATRFHRQVRDIAVLAGQLGHASFNTTQR